MDGSELDAYLARIGAARPARADAPALRELQLRHLLAVPFENLSIHLGERIVLEPGALRDKLLRRRRGGFCYELNGAFSELLSTLGFEVTLLAARVFGSYPLRLDTGAEQADPGGTFRIAETADGDLDVIRDGQPQYRVEPRPRSLGDFEPTCWWQETSPESHFTRSLVCSLLTEHGRITLSDRTLIRTTGEQRDERTLTGDAEVLDAYRSHFGIVLDRLPPSPTP